MIFSLIASFAIGYVIGSVVVYCIDVIEEWLSIRRAKELALERTNLAKLIVENIQKDAIIGEAIHARAFNESNEHFADFTFNVVKGSDLYTGQVIY